MTTNRIPELLRFAAVLGVASLSNDVAAELVIRDINATVDGGQFQFDLDQNGVNDFEIIDTGSASFIAGVSEGATIFLQPGVAVAALYAPGGRVDGQSGLLAADFAALITPPNLSGNPFPEVGDTGFVGLSLQSTDDPPRVTFGFLEITRGSTILGQVGYQTTPGAAAVIPIPEPSAAALLAASVTGLGVRRSSIRRA